MCGIVTAMPADGDAVLAALAAMRHRGPDNTGIAHGGFASVGVARLAITDVPNGHQPIPAPGGESVVGFNGAIYNARALAKRFGIAAPTGNDGEVIWPLYERFGAGFADHLEGMYAICILDAARRELVLAVDPVGIKPLYVAQDGGIFAASTLRAFPAGLRRAAWRVPPGTVWSSASGCVPIRPRTAVPGGLGDLLEASVAEQIPREVPWGCLLSGGVDSSAVTALACRRSPHVRTYTSGFPDSGDVAAADRVAAALGTDHHVELIDPDELPGLLDEVVRVTESPDPLTILAGIGTYAGARAAARDGVKVLLSGEGADELFGGYEDYLADPWDQLEASMSHDLMDLGARECLRLDRCTMAHSIEARVPFLCSSVIEFARALPLTEKIDLSGPEPEHKVALRRVARRLLPREVADRRKAGFPSGTGIAGRVGELARRTVPEDDIAALLRVPATRAYIEAQRGLGVDDRVAALTWTRWEREFTDIAASWTELVSRGLVRRSFREGRYAGLLA